MRRDGKVERLREIRSQTGFKLKLPWLVGIKKITRHATPRPPACLPACLPRHGPARARARARARPGRRRRRRARARVARLCPFLNFSN